MTSVYGVVVDRVTVTLAILLGTSIAPTES
jgi:hypothetical protein